MTEPHEHADSSVQLVLRIGVGAAAPIPVPAALIDSLQSATVEANAGSLPSGFELVFSAGRLSELLDLFAMVGPSLNINVRVSIGLVVEGTPTFLMDGIMTHQEVVHSDGAATLVVKGRDLSVLLERNERKRQYDMPDAMRVRRILLNYTSDGIVPLVVEPYVFTGIGGVAQMAAGLLGGGTNPTGVAGRGAADTIATQDGSDYAYLVSLAAQVGWIFTIEPTGVGLSVAYWGPEIRIGAPQRALTADLDPMSRSVSALNFSFDKERREDAEVHGSGGPWVHSGMPWSPPLALSVPRAAKAHVIEKVESLSPDKARMQGQAYAAAHSDTLFGKGSLSVARYGAVLAPRSVVGVRGAGLANDGLHQVTKVTTTIRRGEVHQAFELVREGVYSTVPTVGLAGLY